MPRKRQMWRIFCALFANVVVVVVTVTIVVVVGSSFFACSFLSFSLTQLDNRQQQATVNATPRYTKLSPKSHLVVVVVVVVVTVAVVVSAV